jgi:hypothetical protein
LIWVSSGHIIVSDLVFEILEPFKKSLASKLAVLIIFTR